MMEQKQVDISGNEQLPAGWQRIPLGNKKVFEHQKSNSKVVKALRSDDGTIPLILEGDLNNTKDVSINKFTTEAKLKLEKGGVIKPVYKKTGTFLMALARDKAGTVGMLTVEKAVLNHAVFAVTPDPNILHPDLLFYYFKNPSIRQYIKDNFMPSAGTYTPLAQLKQMKIPIPPLMQQEQLLRRINLLLQNVEEAQVRLQKNQDYLDRLLSAVVHDTFTTSRREDWSHAALQDVVIIHAEIDTPTQPQLTSHMYIVADDIDPIVAQLKTASALSETTIAPTHLQVLDDDQDALLYAKKYTREENWQTRVIMPNRDRAPHITGFIFNHDLYHLSVRDKEKLYPRFLFWSLFAPQFAQSMQEGSSTRKEFEVAEAKLLSYPLFFPDRNEQERISNYLDHIHTKVSQMRVIHAANTKAIEQMEESILGQAFQGKL